MEAACSLPIDYLRRIRRGYAPGRGHDLQMVARAPNYFGGFSNWSHSGPWPYLQRIPLVLYGPGFIRSQGEISLDREVTTVDIAPTIAELTGTTMPAGRPGTAITEALVPANQRPERPRVIMTIVWDGGGGNVLDRWPNAWPELERIGDMGTSITNATVGSSPSVTPAVHTNLGTGAYPRAHGIVDIPMRKRGRFPEAFSDMDPQSVRISALADDYDKSTDNAALIGMLAEHKWHLGMIGHGASIEGGDRDLAVMFDRETGVPITNRKYFSLPGYFLRELALEDFVRPVDADDGKIDGKWLGHRLNDAASQVESPVFLAYQSAAIRLLLERGGYGIDDVTDLFFTNFKQIDLLGHQYNMASREVESALHYSDRGIGDIVEWLDQNVGANRWVIILTADHGQTPRAQATGGWPISLNEVVADVNRQMEGSEPRSVLKARPVGLWLSRHAREPRNARRIARFLADYRLRDNVPAGEEIPSAYRTKRNSRLFAAAIPSRDLDRVWTCATR